MIALACTFIVSAFNRPTELKLCLLSLILQTRRDWTAVITDNSKHPDMSAAFSDVILDLSDPRLHYLYTGDRANNCYASAEIGAQAATGTWLIFPSEDSYMVPEFLERMLEAEQDVDLAYCDILYDRRLSGRRAVLSCEPVVAAIDKTCFAVRREKFIGFPDQSADGHACPADGQAVERMVALGYRMRHVEECLCVHN